MKKVGFFFKISQKWLKIFWKKIERNHVMVYKNVLISEHQKNIYILLDNTNFVKMSVGMFVRELVYKLTNCVYTL